MHHVINGIITCTIYASPIAAGRGDGALRHNGLDRLLAGAMVLGGIAQKLAGEHSPATSTAAKQTMPWNGGGRSGVRCVMTYINTWILFAQAHGGMIDHLIFTAA